MAKDPLNEREFELINIVGARLANNQRDLSAHMELSLGTINMLVKRLISKGYIRIKQLNEKKVQYILTPKGFAEKMQKSVKYTVKTIKSIGLIKEHTKILIEDYYAQGHRLFYVLGRSDLALLVEMIFYHLGYPDAQLAYIDEQDLSGQGILLVCKENIMTEQYHYDQVVVLIAELAKSQIFINK